MSKRPLFYDFDGNPISLAEFAALCAGRNHEGPSVRWKVAYTATDDFSVSTVWLGWDHAVEGPPMIFETLAQGLGCEEYIERYSSAEEALEGHQRIVEYMGELVNLERAYHE